jgi:hypothetical protein
VEVNDVRLCVEPWSGAHHGLLSMLLSAREDVAEVRGNGTSRASKGFSSTNAFCG